MRVMRLPILFLVLATLAACSGGYRLPQRDSVTPGETITVKGDQSVYAVAKENNVSMRDLIVLNNLQSPYTLHSGQSLTLPAGPGAGRYNGSEAPVPSAAPMGGVESAPLTPIEMVPPSKQPKEKQSLLGAPVTTEALAPPPAAPKPVETTIQPAAVTPPIKAAATVSAPVAVQSPPPPTPVTSPPAAAAVSAQAPAAATASSATAPTAIKMVWPVQGPVISSFGPKGQGLNNDGINIGAPKGAPVVAAANGMIVYAGNEMKGFGNLILIRHQDGWVTAYAHLDRMLVNKDAVVAQGDMIGTVGKTGNVPSPQLHFETRFQGKPVDPAGIINVQ